MFVQIFTDGLLHKDRGLIRGRKYEKKTGGGCWTCANPPWLCKQLSHKALSHQALKKNTTTSLLLVYSTHTVFVRLSAFFFLVSLVLHFLFNQICNWDQWLIFHKKSVFKHYYRLYTMVVNLQLKENSSLFLVRSWEIRQNSVAYLAEWCKVSYYNINKSNIHKNHLNNNKPAINYVTGFYFVCQNNWVKRALNQLWSQETFSELLQQGDIILTFKKNLFAFWCVF